MVVCSSCGQRLKVRDQEAYTYAEDAFLSVQDSVARVAWRGAGRSVFRSKAPPDSLPLTADIIRAYQTAYSGLMVALRGELTEAQIVDAVRMMADITRLFAPRAMASPAEAEYWAKCAVVLIAQQELECIRERVAEPPSTPGLSTTMRRLHDQLRRRQLEKALSRLLKQLNELEHAIGFLDPPCLPLG